ncbi:hypothetical protein T10_3872 [Trichinella papuae]|uniref:PiggyBac transposable element-derived protein domain-containing protein n=1 Tax=Trichinella papuae TaxID=268474 RepID=A0A0V1M7I9_9BILA|nr:hypothetical protein T10_3872 [Trichinella papuae]
MVAQIHRHTNRRMRILKKREFTYSEINAALGTIIRAGADNDNMSAVEELYLQNDSRPFYRCAMSSSEERQTRLSNTIVEQLAQPFVQSNRNVFMDRYFTSHSIVQHLLENSLTAVGTVSANRHDVPLCLRNTRRRDVYSTLAVYEHNKKVIMISYVPRKKRDVLLMTSCHKMLK